MDGLDIPCVAIKFSMKPTQVQVTRSKHHQKDHLLSIDVVNIEYIVGNVFIFLV